MSSLKETRCALRSFFDKDQDMNLVAHVLTQRIEDLISEKILEYPAYWLWSYKHWRRAQGEIYADDHPIY